MYKIFARRQWKLAPALWCVGLALLINALVMLWSGASRQADSYPLSAIAAAAPAMPFPDGAPNARGAYLLPLRLDRNQWGLALMDPGRHVFAIYRILPAASRVQLLAVRNYRYDLLLKDLNNAAPSPGAVRAMVRGLSAAPRDGATTPPTTPGR